MNTIARPASVSSVRTADQPVTGQPAPHADGLPNPSPEIRRASPPSLIHKTLPAGGQQVQAPRTQRASPSTPAALDARPTQAAGTVRRARSDEPVEAIAMDVFKKVRTAYNNGLKSSNKTYAPEHNTIGSVLGLGKRNKDDTQRLDDAGATLNVIRQQNRTNVLTEVEPLIQKKLVIDAANCGELARATAKLATERGVHAEVWRYDRDDHAFAVIGKPPDGATVDFANWKDVWIVDPWTGVASEAPNYIEDVSKRMRKWHADGKVVVTAGVESLPIDEGWMAAIRSGTKSRVEAPSPGNANPWKYLQTAVDIRRVVTGQDQRLPPLKFGEKVIQRAELFDMGAVVDGKPIGIEGIKLRSADGLAGRLNFDGEILRQKIREAGQKGDLKAVERMADILVEASGYERTTGLQPLLVNSKGKVDGVSAALNKQLEKLRSISARMEARAGAANPTTLVLPGKSAITFNNVGVGMQAFGVYNNVRGILDAVARGDSTDIAINAAGIGAEVAGFASEVGFTALGKSFAKEGSSRLAAFAGTSFGKALGGPARIGSNISRAGGAAGALITLPFELYGAVNAFQNAAASEGKTAQDHYVDGGLAVAGIASSLAATGAGAAGLSAAGPAGLVAAGVFIGASRIYHAVRYVEDVSEKIELGTTDRIGVGVSALLGLGASQAIQDRVSVAEAEKQYRASYENDAKKLLEKSPTFGHVIYGDPIIAPRPPMVSRKPSIAWLGLPEVVKTQVPPFVRDNAGNDSIDARMGVESVANAVAAPRKQGDDVLWTTGEGDDVLVGVTDRSNHFLVGGGKKSIVGGRKNDVFELGSVPADRGELDGGGGNNTLRLGFGRPKDGSLVRVVLPTVTRAAADAAGDADEPRQLAGTVRAEGGSSIGLRSIQNVVTSKNARTLVTGNDNDNVFVLNGNGDGAEGGRGNDTFVINGGGVIDVQAGTGVNRYHVADRISRLNIDTPYPDSVHELNLDFNSDEFVVRAVKDSDKLEIVFDGPDRPKKVVISGVFTRNAARGIVPALKDGSISLRTRDGFIMTPTLSLVNEARDGLLHMGAMLDTAAVGAASGSQSR